MEASNLVQKNGLTLAESDEEQKQSEALEEILEESELVGEQVITKTKSHAIKSSRADGN